ncbi:hypothetical protein C6499_06885 [Candidatus Poribacteria bacterium]|nr:MAG: hypothetical protein C6499_06885 [Candidatus Poribacteria bacterium]
MNVQNRTIFSNDNLPVLRGIDPESIDLIYLDPPFNSNRNYAAPIGSDAAGAAFKNAWPLSDYCVISSKCTYQRKNEGDINRDTAKYTKPRFCHHG